MPHLGKKQRDLYVNKKCGHEKNEVTYSQQNRITIAKHVIQGGLKGREEEKGNNLPQFCICYNMVDLC
jgi:hypothetical protein